MGIQQALAYCKCASIPYNPSPSKRLFKFGDVVIPSKGLLLEHVPLLKQQLSILVDIVKTHVPLLIGLDLLDKHRLELHNTRNSLYCAEDNTSTPIARKNGHCYLIFNPISLHQVSTINYTLSQLYRLHKHLQHESAEKMSRLLKRADPNKFDSHTTAIIKSIVDACHVCQKFSSKPQSFQIRFPDDVVFNSNILIDLMFLEKRSPVLHIVDAGTGFQAARFLPGEDSTSVWNTFVECWSAIYTNFLDSILADQGSVFTSKLFRDLCFAHSIQISCTGTESHNSLGKGERYHSSLRRTYMKVSEEHPKIPRGTRLALSVKAANDTMGPDGLVPYLLVFGVMPKLPDLSRLPTTQGQRFAALVTARKEYETIVSKMRVQTGIYRNAPPSSDYILSSCDSVYVYQEKLKHWTGPHFVASAEGKSVYVYVGDPTGPRQFNLSAVKPCEVPPHVYVRRRLEPPPEPPTLFSTRASSARLLRAPPPRLQWANRAWDLL